MTHRLLASAAAISGLALLTACGGGGGGVTATNPVDQRSFAEENATLSGRILGAKTLVDAVTFRAKTVGLNHTSTEDRRTRTSATSAKPQDVAVRMFRANPDDVLTPQTVVLTLAEANPVTFTPEHGRDLDGEPGTTNYQIPGADGRSTHWFWAWDGTPIDHANGIYLQDDGEFSPRERRHHMALGYYQRGDEMDMRRLAVIGLRTHPGDMPTGDAPATYEGKVRLNTYRVNGGEAGGESYRDLRADIELVANFTRNNIYGTMDNWYNHGEAAPGLIYDVVPATITENGYETWMRPNEDCTRCAQLDETNSTVSGSFYGPEAVETGGTIAVEFEGDDGPEVGVGIFYTDRE